MFDKHFQEAEFTGCQNLLPVAVVVQFKPVKINYPAIKPVLPVALVSGRFIRGTVLYLRAPQDTADPRQNLADVEGSAM